MKQLAMAILMTLTLVGSVPAENIIHGARPEKCPTPDKCGSCHANDRFYKEMSESSHKDLTCFDCHVPGVVQKNKYERADRSFNRLGYYIEGDKWHEAMGNDICLRCHPNENPEKVSQPCWSCHMPITGEDSIVFQKVKTQPPKGDNIREIKKMPHRSHLFRFH